MADTTPNYALDLYDDGDPANLRDQYNASMNTIDGILKSVNDANANNNNILNALGATTVNNATNAKKYWDAGAYIDPKSYGALGDGTTDDTTAFKSAITAIKQSNGTITTLQISGGTYLISDTLQIEPWMNIKCKNTPKIKWNGANKTLFKFTWSEIPSFINKRMEQYWQATPKIHGGMFLESLNNTGTAIQVGNLHESERIDGTAWYNVARSTFQDLQIAHFNIGILLGTYDVFLNKFNNIKIENNNIAIQIGEQGASMNNSGENITFTNCVLAHANKAILFNLGGFDVTIQNSGIDFNDTFIEANVEYMNNQINIINNNIEGVKTIYHSNQTPVQPALILLARNIILMSDPDSAFQPTPIIDNANVTYETNMLILHDHSQNTNLIADNAQIQAINSYNYNRQNNSYILTTRNNLIPYGNDVTQLNYKLDNSTQIDVSENVYKNFNITKAIQSAEIATDTYSTLSLNDKIKCKPNDIIIIGAILSMSDNSPNFSIKISYYDIKNTVIKTKAVHFNINDNNPHMYSTQDTAPENADTLKLDFILHGSNKVPTIQYTIANPYVSI